MQYVVCDYLHLQMPAFIAIPEPLVHKVTNTNHYIIRATHIFVIMMYVNTFIAKQLSLTQLFFEDGTKYVRRAVLILKHLLLTKLYQD